MRWSTDRFGITAATALVLAFVAGAQVSSWVLPAHGLRAKYFPNAEWKGVPFIETIDPSPSARVVEERTREFLVRYSVEWTGFIVVSDPGRYTFTTVSDDGSELSVGDGVVVHNGGTHGPEERSGTIDLARGVYPFALRYFQAGGGLTLSVAWSRDGGPAEAIPVTRLSPDAMSYRGYLAWRLAPLLAGGAFAIGLGLVVAWARRRPARAVASAAPAWAAVLASLDRPRQAIAALVVVGVVARAWMMAGSSAILWPDSEIFYLTAQSILQGRPFDHDPFRTPLYPVFLAVFLGGGETPLAGALVVAAQHAMGVVATVLFYLVGRRAFSPRVAFAGALMFSLHAVALFYEASVLSEALFVCGVSVVLLTVTRVQTMPALRGAAAVGALCALLTLVRPVAQWYGLALVPILWGAWPGWRRRLAAVATLVAVNVALLTPWMLVNQREYGFFGVALGQGLGLYTRVLDIDQLTPAADTRFPELKALHAVALTRGSHTAGFVRDRLRYHFQVPTREVDRQMGGFAIETARAHPWRFASQSVTQWLIQAGASLQSVRTCGSDVGRYLCSGRSTEEDAKAAFPYRPGARWRPAREALAATISVAQIWMPGMFGLALLGVVGYALDAGHRNRAGAVLALTFAYFTIVPALTQWPLDRFRLPVDVVVFWFAMIGLLELAALARRRA